MHLHIVCLDVPYPVDHGGIFDLFYKLVALQREGVKIHLHCFEWGRGRQPMLDQYCFSVDYYPRTTGVAGLSPSLPYIVSSRRSKQLLHNLLRDNYPILMEGVHCTYLLSDDRISSRNCHVRLHNVEHIYYQHLYNTTRSNLKKIYYRWESNTLQDYERSIARKAHFWAVSEKDAEEYRRLGCRSIEFLPLFLPDWQPNMLAGKGLFCLYHGNLSVAENEKAAIWLLENVFNEVDLPFIIAGKHPSPQLAALTAQHKNAHLIPDPKEAEMQDLIATAQVHVLPSFNATGIKLKLVNALYNGRFCVVNAPGIRGSKLESTCAIADTAEEFKQVVVRLYEEPFGPAMIDHRKKVLQQLFDNRCNAARIIGNIWGNEAAARPAVYLNTTP